ncbi:MAG: helix-turn-helix transcriptional regulator [Cellulomonadaceae bacterium]|nr:helix-turn-helix transcriptional regulator [Cellulomonadaceae bacterium]
MGTAYYQFCPVAKAMEVLDERWTMLVIRELGSGAERFNELRRGLPRISPTLLSRRLHRLTAAGIVEREAVGADVRYRLSPAGQELRPVVEALGAWGVRWVPELGDADLDPHLLMWDLHRRVDPGTVPDARTVVRFSFPDVPGKARDWWIVLGPQDVDVCEVDPGFDVAATVTTDLRSMVMVWRGDLAWPDALRSGRVQVVGSPAARRSVPVWFGPTEFAAVPRAGA